MKGIIVLKSETNRIILKHVSGNFKGDFIYKINFIYEIIYLAHKFNLKSQFPGYYGLNYLIPKSHIKVLKKDFGFKKVSLTKEDKKKILMEEL